MQRERRGGNGRCPRDRVMSGPQCRYGDAEQHGDRTTVGDEHRPPRRAGSHPGRPRDHGDAEHSSNRVIAARRGYHDRRDQRQHGDGVTLRIDGGDKRAEIGVPQHIQPGRPGQRVRGERHQRHGGENSGRDVRADRYAPARPPTLWHDPRRGGDRERHDGRDDQRIQRRGDDSHSEHRDPEFDDGGRDRGDTEVLGSRKPARPGEYGSHHGDRGGRGEDGSDVDRAGQAGAGENGRDREREEREDPREDVFRSPRPARSQAHRHASVDATAPDDDGDVGRGDRGETDRGRTGRCPMAREHQRQHWLRRDDRHEPRAGQPHGAAESGRDRGDDRRDSARERRSADAVGRTGDVERPEAVPVQRQ